MFVVVVEDGDGAFRAIGLTKFLSAKGWVSIVAGVGGYRYIIAWEGIVES